MQELQGVVLLDVSPGGEEAFDASFLERTEHPVLVCHGPGDDTCPLLTGEGCAMFEAAHGIVFKLDLERPQHRAILLQYRRLAGPELPIRVLVADAGQAERYAGVLADVEVWFREPTVVDLDGFAAEVESVDRLRT